MAVVHYLQVKKKRIPKKSEIHDSARLILISPVCDSQAVCWSRTGLPGSPTDTWWAHRSLIGGCKVSFASLAMLFSVTLLLSGMQAVTSPWQAQSAMLAL